MLFMKPRLFDALVRNFHKKNIEQVNKFRIFFSKGSFEEGWAKMNTRRAIHTNTDVIALDDSDIDELQAMITDDEDEDALDLHD